MDWSHVTIGGFRVFGRRGQRSPGLWNKTSPETTRPWTRRWSRGTWLLQLFPHSQLGTCRGWGVSWSPPWVSSVCRGRRAVVLVMMLVWEVQASSSVMWTLKTWSLWPLSLHHDVTGPYCSSALPVFATDWWWRWYLSRVFLMLVQPSACLL